MKNNRIFLGLILAGAFVLGAVSSAYAQTEFSWNEKLGRGVLNMVGSPVEIARTIHIESNAKGPAYGWTMGVVEGLGKAFVRFGAGAIDTVTSPFNFPTAEKSPLLSPVYPWDQWDVQTLS